MAEDKPLDAYPLTALQQGMLFHSLAAPQQGVYVQQLVCDLREPLHVSHFAHAWEQLVERHSALRTSFAWESRERPCQIVHPTVEVRCELHDWRSFPEPEQELKREGYLQADRRRGFDLARPPLFRLAVFRLAEAHYQLIWTSHHAILDGRSRLILLEELFEIYDAACAGRTAILEPAVPFRIFIDWLQAQDFENAASFWRGVLAGYDEPTVLNVGRSHADGLTQAQEIAKKSRRLSASLGASLRALARSHELTRNTLLQGAWAVLLSRYSGLQKVIFGATRAGRRSVPRGPHASRWPIDQHYSGSCRCRSRCPASALACAIAGFLGSPAAL